ncbi:unnamed protein product [Didymodactylos carnosus]|uniref:Fork-head domain-containing protein n=1 Tax=Didymodactylos carnosus TaxID=1234261 RepID=A0A814TH57_9BILA|nr:unnamed protein product [Didymodactylos carnosus]CAF1159583.1 unnamed protein product [Didymodactylos carnosus]CAF3684698.1 unnamed protein product [Didymodactylos carnosus]CAF3923099.1 unnamed protein product [Didymodactylos carnosus]
MAAFFIPNATVNELKKMQSASEELFDEEKQEETLTIKRPKQSYLEIIAEAILQSPNQMLQVGDLYDYFQNKYQYFGNDVNKSWRNSVRHNLSINRCFVKAGKNSKGFFWRVHPLAIHDFENGVFRQRRFKEKLRQAQQQDEEETASSYSPGTSVYDNDDSNDHLSSPSPDLPTLFNIFSNSNPSSLSSSPMQSQQFNPYFPFNDSNLPYMNLFPFPFSSQPPLPPPPPPSSLVSGSSLEPPQHFPYFSMQPSMPYLPFNMIDPALLTNYFQPQRDEDDYSRESQCETQDKTSFDKVDEEDDSTRESDSKTNMSRKPNQSYLEIIAEAILQAPNRMMQLYEIYAYFQKKSSYFAENVNKSWKNSVRHNLSLNDCFMKASRGYNGKGHYWRIHPLAESDFEQGQFKRRRQRHQIRQWQHQQLFQRQQQQARISTPMEAPYYSQMLHLNFQSSPMLTSTPPPYNISMSPSQYPTNMFHYPLPSPINEPNPAQSSPSPPFPIPSISPSYYCHYRPINSSLNDSGISIPSSPAPSPCPSYFSTTHPYYSLNVFPDSSYEQSEEYSRYNTNENTKTFE